MKLWGQLNTRQTGNMTRLFKIANDYGSISHNHTFSDLFLQITVMDKMLPIDFHHKPLENIGSHSDYSKCYHTFCRPVETLHEPKKQSV